MYVSKTQLVGMSPSGGDINHCVIRKLPHLFLTSFQY